MADPLDSTAVKPAGPNVKKTRKVLVKKSKKPVNKKKYAWLAGHGITLAFGGAYLVFYALRWFLSTWWWTPRICYRLSFIGVLISYSVTVLTTFGGILPDYHTLLATENFQNLVLSAIWLISRPSAFKLIPYYAISLLQLALMFNVKPILNMQDQLSDLISTSEIIVIVALFLDTILFRGTSGFALAIYLMFYWLRINFSPYTQAYILRIVQFIDEKIMVKQKPETQKKWQKLKDFVEFRRLQTSKMYEHDMTHEPAVTDTSSHVNAGRVIEKGNEMEVIGQRDVKVDHGVPQGVIVPDKSAAPVYADVTTPTQGRAAASSISSKSTGAPATPTTATSTGKSTAVTGSAIPASTIASNSNSRQPVNAAHNNGAQSATSAANQSRSNTAVYANRTAPTQTPYNTSQPMNTAENQAQNAINHGRTTASNTVNKSASPTHQAVAQASGRISAPSAPSQTNTASTTSPSKHSLDPRQQLISHAQKLQGSSQEGATAIQKDAQSELEKVKQAAQAQIASTQRGA